jgi:catechol 2,3-dioxygenase-like lactoylglutathione lyase family enzyme
MRVGGILETALYVADLKRAGEFYRRLFGFDTLLESKGVAIESVVNWPQGSTSIYFRDPDGNLGELVSPGLWAIY